MLNRLYETQILAKTKLNNSSMNTIEKIGR